MLIKKNKEYLMNRHDFVSDLHSELFSCIDSMECSDIHDVMKSVENLFCFAMGYLNEGYKDITYFLRFLLIGNRDIPFYYL